MSGRGLCDKLITRPEESSRLWCVVVCDLETSRMGAPYIYDISSLRVNISTDPSLVFLVYDWDPNFVHYWGVVVYSIQNLGKMSLKWKTMEC